MSVVLGRRPAPTAVADPRVLLLASGRAEQGTSTLAALLGILAAAEGTRVLLVDAAGGPRSLPALLGVPAEEDADRPGHDSLLLEERVHPLTDTLALLPVAPGGPGRDPESAGEHRARLHWIAPLYAGFDLVVVDAGHRLDSVLALCASRVDRVIAVTTCDRVALTASYALIKVLAARGAASSLEVLLNGASAGAAFLAFGELEAGARLFLQRGLDFAGAVPDDDDLRAGVAAGVPVQQAAIDSPVVAAVHQIGARIRRELNDKSFAAVEPRLSTWR